MIRALLTIAFLAPAAASAELPHVMTSGEPPIIAAEPMVVRLLAQPGVCSVHPTLRPQPCPQVMLPDGRVQSSFIEGFPHDHGPMLLRVERLTYDWSQNLLSHPVMPGFRVVD